MPAGGKPTMRSRRLGATLKRHRLAAQLDQEHAAQALACSKAKISRVESGINSAKVAEVRYLLDLYGVTDTEEINRLEWLARNANKRGWWMDYQLPSNDRLNEYISLETDATYIRTWQPVFIPGLLQTENYTRALIDATPEIVSPETTETVVKLRQQRRRKFEESDTRFAAVIWEPALTTPMPSRQTHRDQLAHIITMAEEPNITVQVLPLDEWSAARCSPAFTALTFSPGLSPEAVVLDTLDKSMILEDVDSTSVYVHAFDGLRSSAMPPDRSIAFIQETLGRIDTEAEVP
jgi:transcriptional regulator with XRE-family HTH domain